MPRVMDLPKALTGRGLTVETVPGWQTRGASSFAPVGALAHWTAGPRTGDRPSLKVVVNGRSDLPGPLAHVFLTRNGHAVVVAAGRAHHAGAGYYQGATGNTTLFGCECEWDGTVGGLTPEQEWAYPRVMAAFMDLGARFVASHAEYALPKGRKVDVGSYIHTLRAQTAALRTSPTPTTSEEDDMEIHELIDFRVDGRNIWDSLKDIYRFTQTSRDLDTQQTAQITALTAAVDTLATSKGVDPSEVQAAVTRAVDRALADLSITLTTKGA